MPVLTTTIAIPATGRPATGLLQFRYEAILETTRLPASQFQSVGVASLLGAPP